MTFAETSIEEPPEDEDELKAEVARRVTQLEIEKVSPIVTLREHSAVE